MELNFAPFKEWRLNAAMEDYNPVIENFLNKKEFMLLHATAKTGKSMLAVNLALSVSIGKDFLGMPCTKSKVLYLQTEIANYALKERIDLMLCGEDVSTSDEAELNLLISSDRIRLDEKNGIDLLRERINQHQPALVIIDPFYELHRKNEDNASEISPILANIRDIARNCGCAILLIHHQGKKREIGNTNAGHACRGTSSFGDVPDISVSLSKDSKGYSLKGICRNRPSIEDLRLKFDAETLWFELEDFVPKPIKTKDHILQILKMHPDGLTKNEIFEEISKSNAIQKSALQKQLEGLREIGKIISNGAFKDSIFKLKSD